MLGWAADWKVGRKKEEKKRGGGEEELKKKDKKHRPWQSNAIRKTSKYTCNYTV